MERKETKRKETELTAELTTEVEKSKKEEDKLATAITAKMTAHEVRDLDLGYAPPFAPVYDPIIISADELEKDICDNI